MRQPECHPDRKHWAKGKCHTCYECEHTHELRALGLPWWRAQGRTPTGWINKIQRMYETRRQRPEWRKAAYRRQREKYKALYGADPRKNFAARVKWLEAKSAKSAMRTRPGASGAACAGTRICEAAAVPVDSIKTRRGKGNPTLRYRVGRGKKTTRARSKKRKEKET